MRNAKQRVLKKTAASEGGDFEVMDTDTLEVDRPESGIDAARLDSRFSESNLFPQRDPSQTEHMRSSLFDDQDERPAARRGPGVSGGGGAFGGAFGGGGGAVRSWLPLMPELVARPPPLRQPEDAKAAAAFRPVVGGLQSKVLKSLANAWKPTMGEVSDNGVRGAVRAGQTACDLGLRLGRSFRASWGPDGKLFCPRAMGGGSGGGSIGGAGKGFHGVRVAKFDPTPAASGRDTKGLYVEPLRNHLRFARQLAPEAGYDGAATAVPPRWALPRRRNDRPDNYAALVQCIHGYVDVHISTGATSAVEDSLGRTAAAAAAAEDSPEWVLEQSWRLASAMWGQEGEGRAQDLPMPGGVRGTADFGHAEGCDGASPTARREAAVSDWLAQAVASCVPSSRNNASSALGGGGGSADWETWRRVLELLSVRRVKEAASVAMAAGLPRLAVVLTSVATQGTGRPPARYGSKFVAQQASLWQAGGADARMPREAFSVYQLLGRESFRDVGLRGVIGKGNSSLHPSLDWMRQLGLCLWFGAGASAATAEADGGGIGGGVVAKALEAHESLVADDEALPPTARYFLEPTHHDRVHLDDVCEELRRAYVETPPVVPGSTARKGGGGGGRAARGSGRDRCALRRLLAMYPSKRNHGGTGSASGVALLAALEPMAITPDVMDYRHSWHLMKVVEALGVAEVPDRAKAAAVAEGLRFQLVSAGLWEWAVYVALTGEGDSDRRAATGRELVLRHGHGLLEAPSRSPDGERRDLLLHLGVPMAWLHEAAAVRAG